MSRQQSWQWRYSAEYVREAFRFGLKGHARLVLAIFNLRFDQLALGAALQSVELGCYSVAVSLSEAVQMVPDAISTVLFPKLAGDANRAASLAGRATRVTLIVTAVAALVLVAGAVPLIRLVFGESFLPAARMLMWLGPSIVCFSLSKILWNYVYSAGKPHLTIWSVAAAACVTVVMIFPMVRRYGGVGAAITSSCAYAVGLAVDLAIATRLAKVSTREFVLPRSEDFYVFKK